MNGTPKLDDFGANQTSDFRPPTSRMFLWPPKSRMRDTAAPPVMTAYTPNATTDRPMVRRVFRVMVSLIHAPAILDAISDKPPRPRRWIPLTPEIALGAILGAISVCRMIDLNWWLILVPFGGAMIGAACSAWRVNRRSSPDELARLRRVVLRWSVAIILGGPLTGFLFVALAVPRGAAFPFHLAVFTIIGLVAGVILSASLLTAAALLKRSPGSDNMGRRTGYSTHREGAPPASRGA